MFWGGAIILQNVPDANLQLYAASMNMSVELEFDALLPGHHMISLRNGRRHVEAAAQRLQPHRPAARPASVSTGLASHRYLAARGVGRTP